MAFSVLSKFLVGASAVGAVSFFPTYYSFGGSTEQQQSLNVVDTGNIASGPYAKHNRTTQDRLDIDQKHDNCLDQGIKLKIKNPRNNNEVKDVTFAEYKSRYSGWTISNYDYTPSCNRELSGLQ